jgi:hypothetical protein
MGPPGPGIHVEDVATPFEGEPCECHDLHGDGIDDLSMKFETELVVAELQLTEFGGGSVVELVVSGQLLDGTAFAGTDCVTIRPTRSQTGASADEEEASQTVPESAAGQESKQEALAIPSMACGMLSPVFLPVAVVGVSLARNRRRR